MAQLTAQIAYRITNGDTPRRNNWYRILRYDWDRYCHLKSTCYIAPEGNWSPLVRLEVGSPPLVVVGCDCLECGVVEAPVISKPSRVAWNTIIREDRGIE